MHSSKIKVDELDLKNFNKDNNFNKLFARLVKNNQCLAKGNGTNSNL